MEASDLARKAEEIAAQDVGTLEEPVGSNSGPLSGPHKGRINEYLNYTGLPIGSAYCASACSLWTHEAGISLGVTPQLKKAGSALHLWANNPDLQIDKDSITSADLPVIGINQDADGIHGHAFFVVGMDDNTGALQTVDPNSNPAGAREGIGVFALGIRNANDALRKGYLRIA